MIMAVLPFQPTPFFDDKNKAFWNLQIAGWGGAALLRGVSTLANQGWEDLVRVLITSITGFSISLVLSVVYRQLFNRRPVITWTLTTLALALGVGLYAFIDAWVIWLYRPDTNASFAQLVLGVFYLDMTLLGTWSALYYAINFFLQVEEQTDRLGRLQAQATGAQLAMLRYQLNPHFLFNTLNSISTLVLLKQTERANAMLSRLSSFLRYTLANEPTANVTIAQEIETLKLYLEIEKMRFEDRLRPRFDIDPRVAKARLPSLLLQPLVENAIKYAVTPKEDGAEIAVSARLIGDKVQIAVSDTGPGMQGTKPRPSLSTGVGLANIRDRLAQAFGPDHRFETRSNRGGGFGVEIEIPFQLEEPTREAA